MPIYGYRAADVSGKEQRGTLSAESPEKVAIALRKEKLTPISIAEQNAMSRDLSFGFLQKKPKARDLAVFCRQFVSIVNAGVPVISALEMLTDQTENKMLRSAIGETKRSIETGTSLADAMRSHPQVFSEMFITLVAAGEASGSLENSFSRMAEQFEKDAHIKGLVKKASIYPIVVACVAVGVVIGMLIFVIPTFQSMFDQLGAKLPGITLAVIGASKFMQSYWYIVFALIAALVIGLKQFNKTDAGKRLTGKLAMKLPIVKNLSVKTACSRFARTLSTMLAAGLPLIDALDIVASTMTNIWFREALLDAKDSVSVGAPLSEPLRDAGIFPPLVHHMVGIGEETGGTEEMLGKLADYYDEEVEAATQQMMAAIEPLIIVLLAVIVGTIVLSIVLPMATMYSSLDSL